MEKDFSWLLFMLAGIACHSSMMSLYRDALGCDAYIEVVRAGWLPAELTVPLAIMNIAGWLLLVIKLTLLDRQP